MCARTVLYRKHSLVWRLIPLVLLLWAASAIATSGETPLKEGVRAVPAIPASPFSPSGIQGFAGPSESSPRCLLHLAKTDVRSFTVKGMYEYFSDTLWSVSSRTYSVYSKGLLSRQATVHQGWSTTPAPVVTDHYSYDPNGRKLEHRTFTWGPRMPFTPLGAVETYTYNDSGRVAQETIRTVVFTGLPFSEPDYVTRATYSYQNLVLIESILNEHLDAGAWRPDTRLTYYNNADGLPDLVLSDSWSGIWNRMSKTEYIRPRPDSAIVTTSQWGNYDWFFTGRVSFLYDQQMRVLAKTEETYAGNVWTPSRRTVYAYDEDGVVRSSVNSSWIGAMWVPVYRFDSEETPAPSILLACPNASEQYFSTDTIAVRFLGTGETTVSLDYSTDNGGMWTRFASGLPDTGLSVYQWVPGAGFGATKIRAVAGNTSDAMAGTIMILPGQRFLTHATANVQCGVSSTGYLGGYGRSLWSNIGSGPGFRYKGLPNALFSGGVIVGQAGGAMGGMIGSFGMETFAPGTPLSGFTSDAIFNQRSKCTLIGQPPNDALEIGQETASRPGDDFIIVAYNVKNKGQTLLSDFYAGVFADWDIADYRGNRGGIDTLRGLAYEYDPSGKDPNYYGVVALSGMSGAAVTSYFPDMSFLARPQLGSGDTPGDLRTFIGSGPYSIAPGEVRTVAFALLADSSVANLQAHADSVRALWTPMVTTAPAPDQTPATFSLSQNYPNPFNPSTTIRYGLPQRSHVAMTVFNTLGQQVVVLQNGEQEAGYHELRFDASGLSSGVYFYRISASQERDGQVGDFVQTRKLLLIR